MRTSRCATIGVVAELVDMHPSFGIGVVAGNVVGDGRGGGLGALLEGDCPRDFRVSSKDGDWGIEESVSKKALFDSLLYHGIGLFAVGLG